MALKIACPSCGGSMTLKTVKAGRFKLNCRECQAPFALQISEDDPPRIRVRSIDETGQKASSEKPDVTAQPAPKKPLNAPNPAKPGNSATGAVSSDDQSAYAETMAATSIGADVSSPGNPSEVDTRAASTRRSSPPEQNTNKRQETAGNSEHTQPRQAGKSRSSSAPSESEAGSSRVLGGYRILSELGRGGMGAVYLARQLSLARNVALKTIQAHWAENPRVIARFIREAYAAAQLTHHNVVQIYDLGEDQGTNFFSMELIRGQSLEDIIRQKGRLPTREAITCILQAARGLRYAHDNGMVHRDVKPANLMLSDDGLVKVADLGLVKTSTPFEDDADGDEDRSVMRASANSKVTGIGSAMGTPAYMSPEQADDAAQVDHRADIYSLGCTFFALLTGKPPFTAGSAVEVITQHRTKPVVRQGALAADVPEEVGRILRKMTEKKPEERYQNLGDVIQDLERCLEQGSGNDRRNSVERAESLQKAVQGFLNVPAAKLQSIAPMVLIGVSLLLTVITFWISWKLMVSVLLGAAAAPLFATLISGTLHGSSPVADRLRSLFFGASWKDWVQWTAGSILLLALAFLFGMMGYFVLAIFYAAGLGILYYVIVEKPLRAQREPFVSSVESLLKELRLSGMSETAVQLFVFDKSGRNWEEVYSTLFGYNDMRRQRKLMQEYKRLEGKNQSGRMRDIVADRLDVQIEQQKQRHDERMLEKLERQRLKSRGLSDADARRQASELAATMVGTATEIRRSMADFSLDAGSQQAVAHRERIRNMLAQARTGKVQSGGFRMRNGLAWLLPGAMFRFLLGASLLVLCGLWARENDLLTSEKLQQAVEVAKEIKSSEGKPDLAALQNRIGDQKVTKPLSLPVIGSYFNSFAPGVIGLFVVLSAAISGWKMSIPAIAAVGVTLMLHQMVSLPKLGTFEAGPWISAAAGFLILAIGGFLFRRR
ncbi:MAG: protein kinase domain-containing protein [Planctomyces sp.]